MIIEIDQIIYAIHLIALIACLITSLEYLFLKNITTELGVWRFSDLKKEYMNLPTFFQKCFHFIFQHQYFYFLNLSRLIMVFALLFLDLNAVLYGMLLISTIFVSVRFRGTFNGGSDYMLIQVLIVLFLLSIFKNDLTFYKIVILSYLAVQSVFSYFIAGYVKIKEKTWRSGEALRNFLNLPTYAIPNKIRELSKHSKLMFFASWLMMCSELLFPVSFLNQKMAVYFLIMGVVFHFLNFIIFGLNRFFFSWIATYPAIYFISQTFGY